MRSETCRAGYRVPLVYSFVDRFIPLYPWRVSLDIFFFLNFTCDFTAMSVFPSDRRARFGGRPFYIRSRNPAKLWRLLE